MWPRRPISQAAPSAPQLLAAILALLLPGVSATAQSSTTNGATDAGATVTVTGTVYDSLAEKPLAGALVQVVSRGENVRAWNATTGANGEFELAGMPHGLYLVGFLHPSLDSLGLGVPPHMLDVAGGAPVQVVLAVPSAPTIRKLLCKEAHRADSTGLVIGFIRDADTGAPLGGATMSMMWTELVVQKGIHTDRRQVPVKSNSEGWYALCGVPSDGPISAHAELGRDASGYIEITVPPRGLLHRDFNIPRGAAAVAVADSDESAEGQPLRHGTARLTGFVRNGEGKPLAGAQLMVWGSGITGSTGDDGGFMLSELPAGTQALEVRYVGYSLKRVAVDLASNQTRSVNVTLDERADVLDEVTVYGKASKRHHDITGFLERRKMGMGKFITRSDIAERRPFQFTDIMRWVPGFKLVPTSYFNYTILSSRGTGMSGSCQPQIYIDGARLIDDTEINAMLQPNDIAAIEIYAGAGESPPQYTNGSCGSILIWTGPDPVSAKN